MSQPKPSTRLEPERGRLHTAPTITTQLALALRPRERERPETSPTRLPSEVISRTHWTETGTALFNDVWRVVRERLEVAGVPIEICGPERLAFALPDPVADYDYQYESTFRELLIRPMTVLDNQLQTIFQLKGPLGLFYGDGEPPLPDKYIHYFRSFTSTVEDIRNIVAQLRKLNWKNDTLVAWSAQCAVVRKGTSLSIRYAGRSKAVSAQDRLVQDKDRGGFYGAFFKVWQAGSRLLNPPIRSLQLFEFTSATGDPVGLDKNRVLKHQLVDAEEQTIIAILGPEYLLNREAGGFHLTFRPSTYLEDFVHQIKTAAAAENPNLKLHGFTELLRRAIPPSESQKEALRDWAQDLINFAARTRPDHTRISLGLTGDHAMTKDKAMSYADQGLAATVRVGQRDYPLLACLANVPPANAFSKTTPAWEQDARSLTTLLNILSKVWAYEDGSSNPYASLRKTMIELAGKHSLPFTDVLLWPEEVAWSNGCNIAQAYFNITKPLIVLSIGSLPMVVCQNNFAPLSPDVAVTWKTAIRNAKVTASRGQLSLRHYHSSADTSDVRDDEWYIHIIDVHPGRISYSADSDPGQSAESLRC
ncbi:hypothetical protein LTR22_020552 [Elasticomyces elasticus]|nr:hypothetical protein LTR22_020552 [Elasticomyces elasticus]KAK5754940.1 hypothetical protein LTS12_014973 [Elasticomyces elasticus]